MSDPYLGEIRMFGFQRTPTGWQACDGSLLPIAQNEALFALIGTTYGGDGQTSFAVPDLRGRVPLHQGQGPGLNQYAIGGLPGTETVAVSATQMPPHSHTMFATTAAASATTPAPELLPAAVSGDSFYVNTIVGNTAIGMAGGMVVPAGGGMPHENCMPTLAVQYCIALAGIWPARD